MIIEYHRPENLAQVLALLSRSAPRSYPLGGGTLLNKPGGEEVAVVDLQHLGWNQMTSTGSQFIAGASVTLQQLAEMPGVQMQLKRAINLEVNANLRQVATVAGSLVAADGRSPLLTAFLALNPVLVWEPDNQAISLGEWLPLRHHLHPGLVIRDIKWSSTTRLAFEYVARTPLDRPVVCASVACWPSGRTRVALGGYGAAPITVMDGTTAVGAEIAAQSSYSGKKDAWASATYRKAMAGILVRRCLAALATADQEGGV
jgi:CO/xanthine dehydrogenase FAD-binding subunit